MTTASEFFPPTDRELALRGVIHTGWSTVAAKQPDDLKIPKEDVAKIQAVLQRAEEMDKMEELRIGILILKHKQMVDNCRGDGINSCRGCGVLFAPQKGDQPRPAGSQLCTICMKGVCQRCKTFSKTSNGDLQILCQVCANQKELWRRSGAWLNNIMPSISLTDDQLQKAQEKQRSIKRNYISTSSFGRSAGSLPREFMNPARCDSSDESDEEEIEASSSLDLQVNATPKQTPEPAPLPSLKFVKELHSKKSPDSAAVSSSLPRSLSGEVASTISLSATLPRKFPEESEANTSTIPRSFSTGFTSSKPSPQKESKPFSRKSSTDDEDSLTSSKVSLDDKEEAGPLSRGLSRRAAMSSRNKAKMEESRRKAKQMRDSRSPSSTSGNEGALGDRSSSCKEESTASPSPVHVPHIRLRRPTDPAVTSLPKQGSSESEINIEESREFRTGSHGFDHRPSEEIELRSSEETTPVSSPVKTTKAPSKGDSLHYSTIEFAKTSPPQPKASDDNGDLFAKVTLKKTPTTVSDVPKDTSAVHYSQVDFTKTAPKPVTKDTSSEFAKVKSKASTSTTESSQRSKMATITEVSENQPPVPSHRRGPQTSTNRESKVSSSSEASSSPKVPSRSASLKRRSVPDIDTPPEPPARVIAPVASPRDSPKQGETPPPPVRHSRTKSNPLEATEADSTPPPVPRARGRRSADPTQVTPPSPVVHHQDNAFAPPLPLKEEPAKPSKPSFPPRQPKKDSPSVSRVFPPLPPKEDTMPPLPLKESPPVKSSQPPLPPKDDTPTKSKYPPLPLKDNSPSVMPPLPPKDDSPAKPSYPPLPPKEDSPKTPTPRSRPSHPQKDKPSPSRAEMPPLPPKETAPQDSPSNASKFLSTDKPISRGAKARTTIRDKAVMGNLLDEFRKKQAKMQSVSEDPKVEPESSKLEEPKLDPSMLSSPDTSDADKKKSPGNSPLRRRNATRSGRQNRDDKASSGSALTTSGEDFPDGEDSFQFRRRSSAVRGRPKAEAAPEEIKPEFDGGRSRTRSRAVSGMQRPVKRPVRGRPSSEAKSRGLGDQDEEFKRVSARPRSQSPAPDGLCGSIEVGLCFEESSSQLKVTVVKCKGLRSMDANGLSDPYVNIFLSPGSKVHEMHTDIKFKTLDPEYHETFVFGGIDKSCLGNMKLHLVVMDYDEFSKDDFIGATAVNLYELEFAQSSSLTLRRLLDDMVPQQILRPCERYHGRVELKMTYSTEKELFTVHVFGAKQLLNFGTRGVTCNPFVKCHVCCHGNILKQKTKICSKTVDPDFDEDLHFHIKAQELAFCRMTITLQDHNKLKDSFLGELHFNTLSFWRGFMSNPDQVVRGWYELKDRTFDTPKKTEAAPYLTNRRSSSGSQLKNVASFASSYVKSMRGGHRRNISMSVVSSSAQTEGKPKYSTLPIAIFSDKR